MQAQDAQLQPVEHEKNLITTENQGKPKVVTFHPLEHQQSVWSNGLEGWDPKRRGTASSVEEIWPYLNNMLPGSQFDKNVSEVALFKPVDGGIFIGPSNEGYKRQTLDGKEIRRIHELEINIVGCIFTPQEAYQFFQDAALWYIGVMSDYSQYILGVRLKKTADKATHKLHPQIRFWIHTTDMGQVSETESAEYKDSLVYKIEQEFRIVLKTVKFDGNFQINVKVNQQLPRRNNDKKKKTIGFQQSIGSYSRK